MDWYYQQSDAVEKFWWGLRMQNKCCRYLNGEFLWWAVTPPSCKLKDCLSRPGLCLVCRDLQPWPLSHLEIYNPWTRCQRPRPPRADNTMVTANIWSWPALIRTHDDQPPGSLTSDNGHHRSAMLLLSLQGDSLRAICLCINPTNKFRPPLQLIP